MNLSKIYLKFGKNTGVGQEPNKKLKTLVNAYKLIDYLTCVQRRGRTKCAQYRVHFLGRMTFGLKSLSNMYNNRVHNLLKYCLGYHKPYVRPNLSYTGYIELFEGLLALYVNISYNNKFDPTYGTLIT